MDGATHRARPYRSRAVPACQSCRARKSRCQLEDDSNSCLMCRLYKTDCVFPDTTVGPHTRSGQQATAQDTSQDNSNITVDLAVTGAPDTSTRKRRRLRASDASSHDALRPSSTSVSPAVSSTTPGPVIVQTNTTAAASRPPQGAQAQSTGVSSVYDKDQDNTHIIGPANTNDSQVLTDYLSCVSGTNSGMRLVRMIPTSWSKPVMFTPVKNRQFGKSSFAGLPAEKLRAMEEIIGEHGNRLIDTFLTKVNNCFPILDHTAFVSQYHNSKEKISPALLACLYAHSMTYWKSSPLLRAVNPPDHYVLWNYASDALNAEIHTAPSISTIIAVLLDLGGRPTTSLIANAVLLGSAVALAYSLGLNRNPLQWDITNAEKLLRMKIWWALVIHDMWLSFAYGTPPHIQEDQSDVPMPELSLFGLTDPSESSSDTISVFVALAGLTNVLNHYLRYIYHIRDDRSNGPGSIQVLELKVNQWIDGLRPDIRRIIIRGSNLSIPGAANLRLSYLSIRFLLCRLKMDLMRDMKATDATALENRHMQVQSTAEDIIIFLQELDDNCLNDFWLPMSAFTFTSVTTALLRSAVDTKGLQGNAGQNNTSLKLAWDMILVLRDFRDRIRWDLGEHCLQQYSSVVEELMDIPGTGLDNLFFQGLDGTAIDNAFTFDGEFSNIWDTAPAV